MIILQQMIVLFLVMIIGYISYKKGYINDVASKKISSIVVNIANPALILNGSLSRDENINRGDLLLIFVVSIAVYIFLLIISNLLPKILRLEKDNRNVFKVMTMFSNIGFMGFPLIAAVYGSGALLYASVFMLPYNVLIYTYGIQVMKNSSHDGNGIEWKKVFNIGVIACFIAFIVFLLDIRLPSFINDTVGMLSSMTAPLSMIVIGASFGSIKLKSLIKDLVLLRYSVIRQVLIPIIGTLLVSIFIQNSLILGITMILLATPVGSMTAMLAQEFDGNYKLASEGVAVTTVISVISIPVVSAILESLLHI